VAISADEGHPSAARQLIHQRSFIVKLTPV
jgi:hypothetical protein